MARLKVTGFLNIEDMESEHLDLDHPSGLSEAGFLHFSGADGTSGLGTGSLEDLNTEVVN